MLRVFLVFLIFVQCLYALNNFPSFSDFISNSHTDAFTADELSLITTAAKAHAAEHAADALPHVFCAPASIHGILLFNKLIISLI